MLLWTVYASIYTVTLFRTLSDKHLSHLISSGGSLVNLDPVIWDMKVRTNVITHKFYSTSWQSKVFCLMANVYRCMDVTCGILMARGMRSECGVAGELPHCLLYTLARALTSCLT